MARLWLLVALLFSGSAFAGYAQLAPPSGWVAGTATKPAFYRAAANDGFDPAGVAHVAGSIGVAGKAIKVPAALQVAANAAQFLAPVVISNPALATAAVVAAWLAPVGLQWIAGQGWAVPDASSVESDGSEYSTTAPGTNAGTGWKPSPQAACDAVTQLVIPAYVGHVTAAVSADGFYCNLKFDGNPWTGTSIGKRASACAAGWFYTSSGACVKTREYTKQSNDAASDLLKGVPMPAEIPSVLPSLVPQPVPVPVQAPQLDPTPQWVPMGDPVRNPAYKPDAAPSPENQPYLQPGIRVVPRPTPDSPWQVDLQPQDRPVPSSTPDPAVRPDPDGGAGGPSDGKPGTASDDFCALHPNVLACQTLGSPGDATPIPNRDAPISIQPDGGWGPSDGTCPQSRYLHFFGRSVELPFTQVCAFARGVRPFFLGFAWLTAAMALFGFWSRKGW